MKSRKVTIWTLAILCLVVLPQNPAMARSPLHISLTTGYEITQGYAPGFDLTLLYNNLWGIRYSTIPDVQLTEKTEIHQQVDTVTAYSVKGDLSFPMFIRTVDFRAFGADSGSAVDFITAYAGVGYGEINAELQSHQYRINGAVIQKTRTRSSVDVPLTALALGLYMGERFVVVDGKLLYLRGDIDSGNTDVSLSSYDHWLIQISAGFYF